MSAPGKIDPAAQWRVALRIRDEEADRLAQMSDGDFGRAMAKLPEPSRLPKVETLLRRDGRKDLPARAVQAPTEGPGSSSWIWVLAAVFALVLGVGIAERDRVAALLHREAPARHDTQLTTSQRAAIARVEARRACEEAQWAVCGAKLDEAEKLDPAGESDPEVQQMRKKIAAQSWRRTDPTKEKPTPR